MFLGMLAPGDRVERYDVEEVLGRGGMAVVYRVRHRTLRTLHALKVLTLSGQGIRDRLIQEGRIQANLRHPNIVTVTDVVEVDGSPGLLMDYVAGCALDAWLEQRGPLPLPEAERIFRGILTGVAHAHARGTIHRDLKPANVLLAEAEGRVPKIMDFGLARVLEEEQEGVRHTRSGMAMGTPPYMSPEQIRDAKNVDHRADVFALGCILYDLLAGRRAFPQSDILEVFTAVTQNAYARIDTVRPDVPQGMSAVIEGCLEVDRDRRLSDCAAVLRELDEPQRAVPRRPVLGLSMAATMTGESAGLLGIELEARPGVPEVIPPVAAAARADTIALSRMDDDVVLVDSASSLVGPAPESLAPLLSGETLASVPNEPEPPPVPRATRFLPVAAGLVLVVAVLVYGIASRPSAPVPAAPVVLETPAPVPVAGTAADHAAADDAVADDATDDDVLAEHVETPIAATTAAAASPPRPVKPVPRPPTPAATPAATPAPSPAATSPSVGTGQLKFNSVPWSNVIIDGAASGRTPFNRAVSAGPHTIVLETTAGANTRHTLQVAAGGATNWCWDFELSAECR